MMNTNWIWLDMDGTFVDLYGVEGWLQDLRSESPAPYLNARPLVNLSLLARRLNALQRMGYSIGVISWASKNATKDYENAVTEAKRTWLSKHLPSVQWDEIIVASYGNPKSKAVPEIGILFDDEENNLIDWNNNNGLGINAASMLEVLGEIIHS